MISSLTSLFGADDTVGGTARANARLSIAVALLGGLLAGATAYAALRRRGAGLRWPAYLAAGALPGLFIIGAVLAEHLPRSAMEANELPDRLIVL